MKPRPTKNMFLPGGAEIRLEVPKVVKQRNGKVRAAVWVAVLHGSPEQIEKRAAKYAKEVLYEFGYIVGAVRSATWLPVASPVGPVPFVRGRWSPVKVVALVRDDPNY